MLTQRTLAESRGTHVTWRKSLYYSRSDEGEYTGEVEYHREEIAACLDENRFANGIAVFTSTFTISTLAKVTPRSESASFLYQIYLGVFS